MGGVVSSACCLWSRADDKSRLGGQAAAPPCCPPGSHGASPTAASGSDGRGRLVSLQERGGMDVYVVGEDFGSAGGHGASQGRGLVVLSDVCGFASGRHRELCDRMSQELRCPVLMPDLFRGSPPHVPTPRDSWVFKLPQMIHNFVVLPGMLLRLRRHCDPASLVGDVEALLPLVRETCGGADVQVGCVGFCFGAWLAARCLARPLFSFAVGFHPAMNLERLFRGSEERLVMAMQRPMLLLPAGNDPASVKPSGSLVTLMRQQRQKLGEGEDLPLSVEFPRQLHGWMTRGEGWDDPEMVEDRELALGVALRFMEHFFQGGLGGNSAPSPA